MRDYLSRNIVKEVQLDVLETIPIGKQSLSNSDTNNEQVIIDSNLEKDQILESIQGIKRPKEKTDSQEKRVNLKKEANPRLKELTKESLD